MRLVVGSPVPLLVWEPVPMEDSTVMVVGLDLVTPAGFRPLPRDLGVAAAAEEDCLVGVAEATPEHPDQEVVPGAVAVVAVVAEAVPVAAEAVVRRPRPEISSGAGSRWSPV